MAYFSIIIPVYNRPDEVDELLFSLTRQTEGDFEVVIVEDGSSIPCKEVVDRYSDRLTLRYFSKPNTGRSDTRNVGMAQARGEYFIFFDSDCIIPATYFATVKESLEREYVDCFGGPDMADESFSDIQKAINYSMTSFFTTGGIRGGKVRMERFMPRSFNMGFSRAVYERVGGYKDMYAEDIDLSIRIRTAGFSIRLFPEAAVIHKRRVSWRQFYRQVNSFGKGRIGLQILHPGSLKLVHALPAAFLFFVLFSLLGALVCAWALLPLFLYVLLLFVHSWLKNGRLTIALLSVRAAFTQLIGYGSGFIEAFINKIVLRKVLEDSDTLKKKYK